MRIIDLQRRLREIGRIRTGDQTISNGRARPRKLERFRLTSRDRRVIEAAAERWGGEAAEWQAPDGRQWQVYVAVDEIPVVIPPGDMSFSQSYEQWSAAGCQVRCDGRWDHISDQACHCDPSNRACEIHTRLSVMVPDLPGIGVWRLETQSWYAAVELGGLVELCTSQAEAGVMIPARLRLEQRTVKRFGADGRPVTRRFAVPVLDLDVHPLALGAGGAAAGQLVAGAAAGQPAARPAITPVPPPERALAPSVAEQVEAVEQERPRSSRQAPIPRSGLRPRTAAEAAAGAPAQRQEPQPVDEPPPPPPPVDERPTVTPQRIARRAREVFADAYEQAPRGSKTALLDRLRHALVYAQTKGAKASVAVCTDEERRKVWQRLDDLAAGRLRWELDPEGQGVAWISQSGKRTVVMWAELDELEQAAQGDGQADAEEAG